MTEVISSKYDTLYFYDFFLLENYFHIMYVGTFSLKTGFFSCHMKSELLGFNISYTVPYSYIHK